MLGWVWGERAETWSIEHAVKGCVGGGEGISTKDEVLDHELRLSLKFIVVTVEFLQMEELGAGGRELGMGRVGRGEA